MNPELASSAANGGSIGLIGLIINLVIYLFYGYCVFLLAKKMNVANAWMSFIPLLNLYLLVKMGGKPGWWLILFLIPLVNIIFIIIVLHEISKARGHGVGMTLGLIFLGFIFIPVLAFTGPDYSIQPVA